MIRIDTKRGALVDELGELQTRLEPHRADLRREEALRREIRGWMAVDDPEHAASFEGRLYIAQVGPRKIERAPVIAKVFEALGVKKFLQLCSITLKAVEDHVPLPKRDGLIVQRRSGYRDVSVTPKPAAPARKAA